MDNESFVKPMPHKKPHAERIGYFRVRGEGVTNQQWYDLCDRYDFRCLRCGERKPLTLDHVFPREHGGLHQIDNVQPLCRSCNAWKGSMVHIDFRIGPDVIARLPFQTSEYNPPRIPWREPRKSTIRRAWQTREDERIERKEKKMGLAGLREKKTRT